jgi:hypothetical protein
LSIAICRSLNAGTHRPLACTSATRAMAAGDMSASHSPPSEPNAFCGAK